MVLTCFVFPPFLPVSLSPPFLPLFLYSPLLPSLPCASLSYSDVGIGTFSLNRQRFVTVLILLIRSCMSFYRFLFCVHVQWFWVCSVLCIPCRLSIVLVLGHQQKNIDFWISLHNSVILGPLVINKIFVQHAIVLNNFPTRKKLFATLERNILRFIQETLTNLK